MCIVGNPIRALLLMIPEVHRLQVCPKWLFLRCFNPYELVSVHGQTQRCPWCHLVNTTNCVPCRTNQMQDGVITRASLTTPIRCLFFFSHKMSEPSFEELCQDLGRSVHAHRIRTTVFLMYFSFFFCVVEYVSLACHWADPVSIVRPGVLVLDKDQNVLWKRFHHCCWQ